jgi:hypothetical protein
LFGGAESSSASIAAFEECNSLNIGGGNKTEDIKMPNEKFQVVLDSVGKDPKVGFPFQLNTLKLRCEELLCLAETLSEVRQVIPLIDKAIQYAKEFEKLEGVGSKQGKSFSTDCRVTLQDMRASCELLIALKRLPE